MNKLLLTAVLLMCFSANAQKSKKTPVRKKAVKSTAAKTKPGLQVNPVGAKFLPRDIHFEGNIKNAVRWTDRLGDNIVITTETGEYEAKKSMTGDGFSAELFAYHFIVKNGKSTGDWKITDRVLDCPLDMQVHFIKNTFHVTDLDKDGAAEVWMMYKTACHGDVSPCEMKIIMYEGRQKHAIRGTNKVKLSEREVYGGEYKPDEAFKKAPKIFQEHARKMWLKNELEVWYDE